ncbi:MAG: YeeE/YedE family protein [Rhodoferax sp.]|uniref:YeeE/YedE family protein n=1 Tax=Rhodoferax sp. TaxID=50421 RepID=UPI0027315FAF|nr:YeeE/YedE family protein [Rhodoferax sp.]MDP1529411.1 YeeE/YedE family protein [Rhodoferax sp.]
MEGIDLISQVLAALGWDANDPLVKTRTVAWLAFALAFIFGYVGNKTQFCTMGAVSDIVNMSHWDRMRAWLLAIAVAIIGTSLMAYTGTIDVAKTIYTGSSIYWLAALVGGLTFGIGMTLAGGCGQRTLVRLGGGNLKSLIVFIFLGYAALVTLTGIFGAFRVSVLQADAVTLHVDGLQTLPALFGLVTPVGTLAIGLAIGAALLLFVFLNKEFRSSGDNILAGIVIGLIVAAGWYLTGRFGFGEDPDTLEMVYFGTNSHLAESMTFVAPLAYTLNLGSLWTDSSTIVTFGVASVLGVIAGSLVYGVVGRTFRLESFNSSGDMFRHIIGAILMGFGGVTALGCTIGQGVTGISTLAVSSFIVLAAIIAGAALTMKVQYFLMMRAEG